MHWIYRKAIQTSCVTDWQSPTEALAIKLREDQESVITSECDDQVLALHILQVSVLGQGKETSAAQSPGEGTLVLG